MAGITGQGTTFKVYLPMNWGVTTALSIVCFIWTWNAFLWPVLSVTRTEMMSITGGTKGGQLRIRAGQSMNVQVLSLTRLIDVKEKAGRAKDLAVLPLLRATLARSEKLE